MYNALFSSLWPLLLFSYEEVKEVAEARWAYVQMEMLMEHLASEAEDETSSGGGCCSGKSSTRSADTSNKEGETEML